MAGTHHGVCQRIARTRKDIALHIRFNVVEGSPQIDTSRGYSVVTRNFTPRIEASYEGLCTAPAPAQARPLLRRPGAD